MTPQTAQTAKALASKYVKDLLHPNPFSQGTPAKKRLPRQRATRVLSHRS